MASESQQDRFCVALLVGALASTGLTPLGAQAQEGGGIEEITVTARKREESVQDVPVLVTALSAEQVRKRDLTSLEKVAATTPNFNVGRASNGSGAQMTLRGIGSSSTSIGIEQSVAVVVDGVYYGQGRIIQEGFFDLDRIEILKGPQALFFGKNATAGVISITSADPTPEAEFLARASYEFDASELLQLEAIGSGPLTDTLGLRVAIRGSKMYDGYFTNETPAVTYPTFDVATGTLNTHTALPAASTQPGEEELLGRATLKWQPNDELTATLKYTGDYNLVNNSSWNYVAFRCPEGVSQLNGLPCREDFITRQANMPADMAADFPFTEEGEELYNRYSSYAITGSINYELDNVTFTWVTNYQRNNNRWLCNCDFQASPITVFATENATWKAFSSELRALTQFDGPFNAMIGILYQDTKRDFEQYIAFGNVEDSTASPAQRYQATSKLSNTDGETISPFVQLIWEIGPTLEATVGARYTDETKDSVFSQPYNNPALTFIFRPADAPDGLGVVTANQEFDNVSPEATLTWTPADDIMLYAAYKTAYKSGGFSNSGINSAFRTTPEEVQDDFVFNPEEAEGFEIGAKTTLWDRQLRLNATAYTYDYDDLQVDFFNSAIFAFNTVTADAQAKGIDLELQYAPNAVEGLTLFGAVNYNDAEYTRAILPCYAGQTPAEGCSIPGAFIPFQDLDGTELAMAPQWAGFLGGTYEMQLPTGHYLTFSADARYSDTYLASGFGNPLSRMDSYVYWSAGIRLASADDSWEFALLGKNLSDEFYVTGVVDGPSTPPLGSPPGTPADQLGFATLPRTITAELTLRF